MVTKNKQVKKEKISLSYNNNEYSEKEFLTLIEKRVRKDVRINKKVKGTSVELLNDSSKEYEIAKIILTNIFGKHLKIKEVKKAGNKTLVPTNLDREINNKLKFYLQNKKPKGELKILNNVLEEEIIIFCKLKKVAIKNKEEKNGLIEMVEKEQPGTKFALNRSFEKIFPEKFPK